MPSKVLTISDLFINLAIFRWKTTRPTLKDLLKN
jgi:hypothetical protein